MRALACPASLKGVLSAAEAAAALAEGLRTGDADAVELPIADGGEGTADALWLARAATARCAFHDAFGRPRGSLARSPRRHRGRRGGRGGPARSRAARAADGVEPRIWRAVAAASRAGRKARARARRHGHHGRGRGLSRGRSTSSRAGSVPCDVTATLAEAPRVFGPQKGAGPSRSPSSSVASRRGRSSSPIATAVHRRCGRARRGACVARRGLVPGAPYVLERSGSTARR